MEDRPGGRISFTSFLLLDAIFTAVVPCERLGFVIFVNVLNLPALHFTQFQLFTATPARRMLVENLSDGVLFRDRLLDRVDLHGIQSGGALLRDHCRELLRLSKMYTICLSFQKGYIRRKVQRRDTIDKENS